MLYCHLADAEILVQPMEFDIPAGNASESLSVFASQGQVELIFTEASVEGVQTDMLKGVYDIETALNRILESTGLMWVKATKHNVYAVKPMYMNSVVQGNDPENNKILNPEQNMKIKNKGQQTFLRSILSFAFASLTSYWVSAQNDDEEDILYLSPFVVQTETDAGYLVGNTLGATRTNVALKDLPFQINVITSELIEDTASYNVDYAIDYLPGTTLVFNEFVPVYSIRGFVSSAAMRNGVRSLNKPDASQIQRIEAVKGPAALLYGQTQPGGVINYITKQPQFTPAYSANISTGNHGLFRSTVSTTGAIGGSERLAYRLDAAYHEQGKYDYFQSLQRFSISPMFLIKLTDKTELLLSYNIQDEENVGSGGLPLKTSDFRTADSPPKTHWVTELGFNHSKDSPDSIREIDTTSYEVQLRHNFFEGLDLRVNFSQLQRDRGSIREGGTGLVNGTYIPGVTGIRNTAFLGDIRDQKRTNLQADLAYSFDTGPLSHQLVVGYEHNDENEYRDERWWAGTAEFYGINPDDWPELSFSTGGVFVRFAYDVFDPASEARRNEFVRRFMPKTPDALPVRPNRERDNEFNTSAYYANWQITWNENKGRILLGGRFDDVEHFRTNYASEGDPIDNNVRLTNTIRNIQQGETDHFSPQAGISYAITDAWTVYALFSKSVNPRFALNPTRPDNADVLLQEAAEEFGGTAPSADTLAWGQLYEPETGRGYEAGFKYAPVDNRMGITVAFYDIEKQDIVRSNSDPILAAVGIQELSGIESSTGIDIDYYLNLMGGKFQLVGGYTYADTEQVTRRPGLPLRWAPEHQGSAWGNYKFDNGFSAGLGVTFIDDRLEDSDTRISPGYDRWDARVSYKTEIGKFPTTFGLNIRNLFDTRFRIQRDTYAVPLEWILSVKVDL